MATAEPLTQARLAQNSDSPLGGLVAAGIADLASFALPRFASTAERDAAYSAWVAAGHTMTTGLRCVVNGHEMSYRGSSWQYVNGIVTVPDRAARDALAPYDGLHVYQADVDLTIRRVDGGWRLASPQDLSNSSLNASNTTSDVDFQDIAFTWTAAMGAKVVVPADGVARTIMMSASVDVIGDGWMHIAAQSSSGATSYWPNGGGRRARTGGTDAVGDREQELTILGRYQHTGATATTIWLEAKATAAGSVTFNTYQLSLTAI